MEILGEERISKRYLILENLEYYIDESIYYRSFSDEIKCEDKYIVFCSSDDEGKVKII